MAKFRAKIKGQAKGKRWAKGHSCSSNPQTKTYREQARSRFFQANIGSTGLTTAALLKHDASQTYSTSKTPEKRSEEEMDEEEDCESVHTTISSYNTFKSFASDWSRCTNLSFKRFLHIFRADSAIHKEMLAILAAITEVIKQQGGNETPTEYYCALLTTLEEVMTQNEWNEQQLSAILSLLKMGIKTVPIPVLRSTFASFSQTLSILLSNYAAKDNNLVFQSIMGCFGVLLKQQELAVWQLSQTEQMLMTILNPFCIHSKPKWRKAAQQAIILILTSDVFKNDQKYNPAADIAAKYCLEMLDSCLGSNSNSTVLASSVQAGQTTILHTLGLLKAIIVYFNKNCVKTCLETILRLMSLNYPIVTSCGLQILHSLFSCQNTIVGAKLNAQIIVALYDYQPSALDSQPTLAWLTVMQQAHIHLADVDIAMCSTYLPKIFTVAMKLLLSQKADILMAATRTLEMLFKDAISQIVQDPQIVQKHESNLLKCFQSVELGLGYQYHHAWPQVLHILSIMFEICGTNCTKSLLSILKTLSELRDSYKFSYNNELENAVGAAVSSMGPEAVLNVISLRKESGEMNLDRSWLLPVLRNKIHSSTLDFWLRGILPLAMHSKKRSVELGNRNDGIGAHSAELMYIQLWNLLPSFCNNASDIHANFKSVAKVLGKSISDNKDIRLGVLASLRKLIACAQEHKNADDIAELARFDKNYLPILFNLYLSKPVGTDEEGQRLAAMETIRSYLQIARPEMSQQLFDSALQRLESFEKSEGEDVFIKESILDLIKALMAYQPKENIKKLYDACIKDVAAMKNNREQKKAYRILEEICTNDAEGCVAFLKSHRKTIQKLLMGSLSSSATSSNGTRLKCIHALIKLQPQLDYDAKIVKATLPEAILGCKDLNKKCRLISYEILNTIGDILLNHDQMQQFVGMIIAGLAGTADLISAALLALASILHNFTGSLGMENIVNILENVLQLIVVPTRDIAGGCLSFLKVFISSLPSPMVASHLQRIVKALCGMSVDCQRHFRLKTRILLTKLVRKFGCDAVIAHVPVADVTMYHRLRNIRKLQSRSKRQKEKEEKEKEEEAEDVDMKEEFAVKRSSKSIEEILADSESDIDDDEETQTKTKKSQRKFNAFIQEDPDSIVDFKDPSVVSKISTSKPENADVLSSGKEEKKERSFKTAADGRIIIANDASDDGNEEDRGKQKKKTFVGSDSESDEGDTLSRATTEVLRDRKRKRSDVASMSSSIADKYQPGGSGIHRNVGQGSVRSGFGSEYKSKKAKGDMKQKGKVDPFAYVPLQRSALNRRKRMKHAGQFKNIVGGARVGSKKGVKARKRLGK